jgi:hypothetical protein
MVVEDGFVTIYCIAYNATLVEHLRDFLDHLSLYCQYVVGGFDRTLLRQEGSSKSGRGRCKIFSQTFTGDEISMILNDITMNTIVYNFALPVLLAIASFSNWLGSSPLTISGESMFTFIVKPLMGSLAARSVISLYTFPSYLPKLELSK